MLKMKRNFQNQISRIKSEVESESIKQFSVDFSRFFLSQTSVISYSPVNFLHKSRMDVKSLSGTESLFLIKKEMSEGKMHVSTECLIHNFFVTSWKNLIKIKCFGGKYWTKVWKDGTFCVWRRNSVIHHPIGNLCRMKWISID